VQQPQPEQQPEPKQTPLELEPVQVPESVEQPQPRILEDASELPPPPPIPAGVEEEPSEYTELLQQQQQHQDPKLQQEQQQEPESQTPRQTPETISTPPQHITFEREKRYSLIVAAKAKENPKISTLIRSIASDAVARIDRTRKIAHATEVQMLLQNLCPFSACFRMVL
jgi:hypothetical protein